MLHQKFKNIYYSFLYPISLISLPFLKIHYKIFKSNITKIHVGCGENYLKGFINIDGIILFKNDYLIDIRVGLPFPDNSMDFIYSCHMLEHVYIDEAINILKEWYRVLKPSGYVRLTLPDFQYVLKINAKEIQTYFPRSFSSSSGQAINFLFCDGQHKYAYSIELIEELALSIGFSKVILAEDKDSNILIENLNEPPGSFSVNLFKS